jgi:hypothetical protein
MHSTAPQFREVLPPSCPTSGSANLQPMKLLRLVGPHDLCNADFHSHMALNFPCPSPERACEWASCSMFLTSTPAHQLNGLRKFKRLKGKTRVAFIDVNQQTGIAHIKDTKHVDVWMYSSFDPVLNHSHSVDIDDYQAS